MPTGKRALRWIAAATVAAIGLMASVPRPASADGFPKEDPAKAMMLFLSMSQAMSQKGVNAPRPRAAAPVVATVAPTEAAPAPATGPASAGAPAVATDAPDFGN